MMIEFSPKIIKLILHIHQNGSVSKSTKPFVTTLTYYNYLGMARDMKLIRCNGFNESNQKTWILTELGNDVAMHLKSIYDLMQKAGDG